MDSFHVEASHYYSLPREVSHAESTSKLAARHVEFNLNVVRLNSLPIETGFQYTSGTFWAAMMQCYWRWAFPAYWFHESLSKIVSHDGVHEWVDTAVDIGQCMGKNFQVVHGLVHGKVWHEVEAQLKQVNRQPGNSKQNDHGCYDFSNFPSSTCDCHTVTHHRLCYVAVVLWNE